MRPALRPLLVGLLLSACSDLEFDNAGVEARGVPSVQSAAARALRLPRMRPSESRVAVSGDRRVTIRARVLVDGVPLRDTTVQARSFDPNCETTFVDTAASIRDKSVRDAIVWIEGPTRTLQTVETLTRQRPQVRMQECQLLPRMQVAAPGSTLQLVMGDSLRESLVLVPTAATTPVDTISFQAGGQLIPVRGRADTVGVLGIYAQRLPWARAFIAIAPPASVALSDSSGRAQFTVDGRGTTTIVRAWHPALGIVSRKVTIRPNGTVYDVDLTFVRR
jgi:hypothetical protein